MIIQELNFSIKYIVQKQDDILPFQISLISCYDDILSLGVSVNVETSEELASLIKSLKVLNGVTLNVFTTTPVEGILIPNNCIVLPNTLKLLKQDDQINICHPLVKPFSEDLIKEIDNHFETQFKIPSWIIQFGSGNVQEMNFVLSTILYRLNMIEDVNSHIESTQK